MMNPIKKLEINHKGRRRKDAVENDFINKNDRTNKKRIITF